MHEETVAIEHDGLKWDDMCEFRSLDDACIVSGPTQFWSNNKTLYDLNVHSDEDLRLALSAPMFPSGQRVNRKTIFGLVTTADDNTITAAEGMSQTYDFNSDYEDTLLGRKRRKRKRGVTSYFVMFILLYYDLIYIFLFNISSFSIFFGLSLSEWELDFVDRMAHIDQLAPAHGVSFHYMAARSMDDELARASMADTFTFVLSYTLMSSFTGMFISRGFNAVESRVGLSLCGIFCIVLGRYVCGGNPVVENIVLAFPYTLFLFICWDKN
jgi:hypothetical protein